VCATGGKQVPGSAKQLAWGHTAAVPAAQACAWRVPFPIWKYCSEVVLIISQVLTSWISKDCQAFLYPCGVNVIGDCDLNYIYGNKGTKSIKDLPELFQCIRSKIRQKDF